MSGVADRAKIAAAIARVGQHLVERDTQARCLVLAALCGEHVLFIGPPGTAKSELARRLHRVVGGRYFERLLTRFTVPEELFGPLSLAALDEGRYERDLDGYLPTASIAFLDEVFKANSAILNALLTLLNEREFDQGVRRIAVPLACVVAASNEVPQEEALRAFFDRFLFRCAVAPVSDAGFRHLLAHGDAPVAADAAIGADEIARVGELAARVGVPSSVADALVDLRVLLAKHQVDVSDRRWVRIVRVLRIAALTNGRDAVAESDLWVLTVLAAHRAEDAARIEEWLAERAGAAQPVHPAWLARVVEAFTRQVELEGEASELAFDDSGKLSLMRGLAGAGEEALAGAAPRMSAFSRRRSFGEAHVAARLAQVDAVIDEVDRYLERAGDAREDALATLRANLWVPAAFADRIDDALEQSRERVAALREGLLAARAGFDALPRAGNDEGLIPDPVPTGR